MSCVLSLRFAELAQKVERHPRNVQVVSSILTFSSIKGNLMGKKRFFLRSWNNHTKIKRNHKCSSTRELDKIVRKYCKYVQPKDWYEWYVHYEVHKDELTDEKFIRYAKKRDSLDSIRRETIDLIKKGCMVLWGGDEYILDGILITNEDYYYMCVCEKSGLMRLYSCVGSIEQIGDVVIYKNLQ